MEAVRERFVYPVQSKADDIGGAVVIDVGYKARVGILAGPAACPGSEGVSIGDRRLKRSVAIAERHIYVCAAEPDDVDVAVAVGVGQLAWKLVVAGPAAC